MQTRLTNMKSSEQIQQELNALGAFRVSGASKAMPFVTPEGYFDLLDSRIQSVVHSGKEDLSSFLLPKYDTPFADIPFGYFEGLGHQILDRIHQEDKEEPCWSKANPYLVPAGYFETSPTIILNNIKPAQVKRLSIYRTVQLAASIALIVFVGLGLLQLNQQNSNLAWDSISKSDIEQYVFENIDDFDTDIVLEGMSYDQIHPSSGATLEDLSAQEIEDYLNEEGLGESL